MLTIRWLREQMRQGKSIFDLPLRVTFYARVSTEKVEQRGAWKTRFNITQSSFRRTLTGRIFPVILMREFPERAPISVTAFFA